MRNLKRTSISIAAAHVALIWCGVAIAQTDPATPVPTEAAVKADAATPADVATPADAEKAVKSDPNAAKLNTVVVTGQRKALESSIERKRDAEEIIDGVTADEAGKLPDASITEVLQRVVGMTMDHTRAKMSGAIDEQFKFIPEGAGVQTRGLSWGNTTVNGRETFSAGWPGREISWDEVPSEVMAGVDVYKNPSAEVIEGGISGSINMRTKLPFDSKDQAAAFSFGTGHSAGGNSPRISGMYSTRWDSPVGQLGWLVDLGYAKNKYVNENTGLGYFYPRQDITMPNGKMGWVPNSYSWSQSQGDSERGSLYAAFQWKKNDKESSITYFDSNRRSADSSYGIGVSAQDPYRSVITNGQYDANGIFQSGSLSFPSSQGAVAPSATNPAGIAAFPGSKGGNQFAAGGLQVGTNQGYSTTQSRSRELAWNFKWAIDERWSMQNDLQWEHSTNSTQGAQIGLGTFVPSMNLNLSSGIPVATFDQNSTAFLANPNNYYLDMIQPNMNRASADLVAWKADAKFRFDDDVLRDFRFGARLTTRRAMHQNPAGSGWYGVGQDWAVQPTSVPGQLPVLADFQNPDGSRNYGILWKNINYPYMNDPRFVLPAAGGGVTVASFSGKNAGMPNIVVPSMALLKNYPGVQASPGVAATGYYAMANLKQTLCSDARNVQYTASNGLAGQLYGNTAAAPSSTNQYGTPYNPGGCVTQGLDFTPQSYSNVIQNPNNGTQAATDKHSEDTQAIYGSLRFGFEDWKFPVDGFAGLRVIRTRAVVHGWTTMNLLKPDGNPSIPKFDTTLSANTPIDYVGTSVDAIPSLNLKAAFSPTLQGRLALSQGMYRPGFNQLQEYINFNQQVITLPGSSAISQVIYNGGNSGNAKLKPVKSNNADLSLEWYPANGQSVTAALFAKQVKDIIMSDTYIRTLTDLQNNTQDFIITGPANAAKLWQAGFEISGMTYLDKVPVLDKALPEWAKGFGVSSNASILAGKQDLYHPYKQTYCPASGGSGTVLNLYGCDTNGIPYKNLPVPYWSKWSFNFALMYDQGPFSARLAYSWRDKALVAINAYGTGGGNALSADPTRRYIDPATGQPISPTDVGFGLPVWDSARGQLDGGFSYKFNDHMSIGFSVSNLSNTVFKSYYQQAPGMTFKSADSSGRSYGMSGNYWF